MVRRRRRALGTRAPRAVPQGPNQRWSLDFAADALVDSRRFRILAVVDDFSRECLALVADTSLSGVRVARELDRLVEFRGAPLMVVSDNGTELTSNAVLRWQEERGVEWHYIAPGKPQQNGRHERMHLTLQQETASPPAASLSAQIARFESFQQSYNHDRPHEALGQRPPVTAYRCSPRTWDGRLREPNYPADAVIRRVRSNGEIKWKGGLVFLSETLIGEPVGLRPAENGHSDIWYGPIRLASVDHRGRLTHYSPSPKAKKPVDLLESESALPTTPQAQQPPSGT
jgi:putative transposase